MRHFGSTVQGVHLLQGSVASFLQGWPHQKSLEGRYRRWLIWKSLDRWISHLENQHGLGSQLHAVCLPAIVEFNMRCRSLNGVDKLNGLETDIMEGTNLGVGISNSTVIWQFLWSFTILICTCCPHVCKKSTDPLYLSFQPGKRWSPRHSCAAGGWTFGVPTSVQYSTLQTTKTVPPNSRNIKTSTATICFPNGALILLSKADSQAEWRHAIFAFIKAIKPSGVSGN